MYLPECARGLFLLKITKKPRRSNDDKQESENRHHDQESDDHLYDRKPFTRTTRSGDMHELWEISTT